MEIYITTNEEGFLTGYSTSECVPGKKIEIDENDVFFQRGFASYKYKVNQLIFDENKEKEFQYEKTLQEAMLSTEEQLLTTQEALVELYEQNTKLGQQLIDTQLAMVDMYEANL
ncbi:TPA: hypothetical protein RF372_000454 [Listeria monocytogenes]|uniref:Lin1291 protein n=1 Tax=Listeria innocua serovar 6a (strain ATCC BAA-680 / CLIP 11262) TaxID=272626 RepID=Q92C99_LISIN|nr:MULTISPECIES: hypothetical protein [Listeria]EAE5606643.1 hypothetical protein [Listeria monocytogenes]EAE9977145.1 hypothetical protein [Listeria monocytogenes]EAE9987773.1 hypothetical protein [Listeria monocytogenes]EAE9989459.1 hypothetical protein [Listeria monocytogenes]EAE9991962.1 hypothetical protein [Listeria monocytogenes]